MKKLLITTDNFLPRIDGVSIFLSKIIPELAKKFDITIIAPNYGQSPKFNAKIIPWYQVFYYLNKIYNELPASLHKIQSPFYYLVVVFTPTGWRKLRRNLHCCRHLYPSFV